MPPLKKKLAEYKLKNNIQDCTRVVRPQDAHNTNRNGRIVAYQGNERPTCNNPAVIDEDWDSYEEEIIEDGPVNTGCGWFCGLFSFLRF
ncbi:hypothetical protein COBT_002582 [Conglomerata obtusa]